MVNLVVILAVRVVEQCMCQDLEVVLVVQQQQIKDMMVHLLQDLMHMVVEVVVLAVQEVLLLHRVDLVAMEYGRILQELLFNVAVVAVVVKIIQERRVVVVLVEVELVKPVS